MPLNLVGVPGGLALWLVPRPVAIGYPPVTFYKVENFNQFAFHPAPMHFTLPQVAGLLKSALGETDGPPHFGRSVSPAYIGCGSFLGSTTTRFAEDQLAFNFCGTHLS